MSDLSPSVLQLTEGLADLLRRLEAFGYDEIKYESIRITPDVEPRVFVHIYLVDDFQEGFSYGETVQTGFQEFDWNTASGRFIIPQWFKNREQRELEIAVKKLGQQRELASRMRGAFAAEYVRRLTEDLERFKLLSVSF